MVCPVCKGVQIMNKGIRSKCGLEFKDYHHKVIQNGSWRKELKNASRKCVNLSTNVIFFLSTLTSGAVANK